MIVAYTKQLNGHWPKMAKIVRDLSTKKCGAGPGLYGFIDFILSVNTPLTSLIAPLVHHKVGRPGAVA